MRGPDISDQLDRLFGRRQPFVQIHRGRAGVKKSVIAGRFSSPAGGCAGCGHDATCGTAGIGSGRDLPPQLVSMIAHIGKAHFIIMGNPRRPALAHEASDGGRQYPLHRRADAGRSR